MVGGTGEVEEPDARRPRAELDPGTRRGGGAGKATRSRSECKSREEQMWKDRIL